MTMSKKDLKKLFDSLHIPEPGEDARQKALEAALAEFDRLKQAEQKKIKGFSHTKRLTDQKPKGGSVMRKPLFVTAGLAAGFMVLMAIILPNFLSYRTRSPSYDTASREMMAPARQAEKPRFAVQPQKQYAGPDATSWKYKTSVPSERKPLSKIAMNKGSTEGEERVRLQDQEYVGRDRFEKITPNPVKVASEEPVSTFSIDVDTASYAFVRRALNRGVLPQKNAVRIEEMINYFDYDYPLPGDSLVPFKPTVAVFPTPWNPDTKLLHIGIKGLDIAADKKPRANLVFLLDVSGSMNSPDKLPLLKNAFRMLVETLAPNDTVAIVVYAGAAGTVLEPTQVKEKAKIIAALDRLSAGGSTAGGEGIRQAYALAEGNFDPKSVNRVILATDGDFNVGIRNPDELKGFVERKRQSGIFLSVLGFGQGNYNDVLMQKLAQNGNGNAAYIDTLNEARKVLVDEAGSTLFTIAKDVKIQIEFNPAVVAEYRLIGYETRLLKREDFRNDRVDAGDVGSGRSVTAIYEITPKDSSGRLIDDLRYETQNTAAKAPVLDQRSEYAFLKIRYKLPDAAVSKLITTPVGRDKEFSSIGKAPGEARFAAAVAAFGQLLRGESYIKDFTFDDIIGLAQPVRGKDSFGYRMEFLNLVRLAKTARAMGNR
ncbi:MAG: VWA domain-containing protein [Deltaproteobacteria bacterium]|nr:VWA domain-containing protein [Deltaproteobacteria bacterium]